VKEQRAKVKGERAKKNLLIALAPCPLPLALQKTEPSIQLESLVLPLVLVVYIINVSKSNCVAATYFNSAEVQLKTAEHGKITGFECVLTVL
jgi:hypothetical protein